MRPDPALGIFETLFVLDGSPVKLKCHLDRMAASLKQLYGLALPAEASALATECSAEVRLGRLRLTAIPAADDVRCRAVAEELDPGFFANGEDGVDLIGFQLTRGLGSHKWVDRSLLPDSSDGTALLLDRGEALEASWANLFAILGDTLVTPPLDGRVLPGVTRAATIVRARARGVAVEERSIALVELHQAEEIFITSAIRGIVPALSLDGTTLPRGDLARQLAEERRRERSR
jgi:para-aminobenzoate synthetase / 4-amino-4-deoxychorismate lyase